ncbi:F1F0 ATP synthase subunit 5 [Sporobolomyces salmoneus]|uniref:F1F0 ATP synthase subunit 5 n=1 Tax=Sporobolomyces salmoneus TaxID=183962 RepID=UPI00317333E1
MFSRQALRSVRTYATQAPKHVVVPIQLNGLAGKYAGALYSAAVKNDALNKVEADLKGVKASLGDASVQDFLANPILSSSDKASGIEALLKKSSPKGASDLTKNFFQVLADNGRLYETNKVITDFLEIMSAHRGEVKVTITSAAPLEKDLQKRLEDALKASQVAKNGKSLVIENKTNESILGGIVVDFGDRTLDLSVASKVSKLNAQLQESV